MCIPYCNPSMHQTQLRNNACAAIAIVVLALAAPNVHALSSDRDQPMDINADHAKITQGTDKAPGLTYLTGNVRITRGSMRGMGAQATIYQHPAHAKDAQGKDISSEVQRVILIGKQAHMEELGKDNELVKSDADKIDYNADSGIAELTGSVTVVRAGHGEFHGAHMTYNTNTGEMESGDSTPENRVHLIIQPKAKTAAKPSNGKEPDVKPSEGKGDAS